MKEIFLILAIIIVFMIIIFTRENFNSEKPYLKIKYLKEVNNNDFLNKGDVSIPPQVSLVDGDDGNYTLIMTDPDIPEYVKGQGEWVHWFITNIPYTGSLHLENGKTLIPYHRPDPLLNSGRHRYIFRLYKQKNKLDINSYNDNYINIDDFVKKHKLKLVGQLQFIIISSSGIYA